MRTKRTHERTIKAVFFDLFGTLPRLEPLDAGLRGGEPELAARCGRPASIGLSPDGYGTTAYRSWGPGATGEFASK